jgi:succinate dehydrogenase / fumarate reductase flavoprotein subunit
LSREGGENPAKVVSDLRQMMQQKAGIIRTGNLLLEAIADLDSLEERAAATSPGGGRTYNPGWHQALELSAMIEVSRMCALAAHRREESRGAHTRDDFPETDHHHWGKVTSVISMGEGGSMDIDYASYPPISEKLRSLLDADDLHEEE